MASATTVLASIWPVLRVVARLVASLAILLYFVLLTFIKWLLPERFRKSVAGDVVLITGAASGLGRLLALKLAKLGAVVVVWDINEAGLRDTALQIRDSGGRCHSYSVDVSSREAIYATAARVKRDVGAVTMLINNAGIVNGSVLLDTEDDRIRLNFDVNILAHIWTVKAFLPDMIAARKGHIVSIGSMSGYAGIFRLVDYATSKSAAIGFDESLRAELAALGYSDFIKNTLVNPYFIDTGMFSGVRSSVLPILIPESVAEHTVQAILLEKEELILPRICCAVPLVKSLLPKKAFVYLSTYLFGLDKSMTHFSARKGE